MQLLMVVVVVVGRGLAWELTLLHVNDIHVRMEETNKYSAACRYLHVPVFFKLY